MKRKKIGMKVYTFEGEGGADNPTSVVYRPMTIQDTQRYRARIQFLRQRTSVRKVEDQEDLEAKVSDIEAETMVMHTRMVRNVEGEDGEACDLNTQADIRDFINAGLASAEHSELIQAMMAGTGMDYLEGKS